MSRSYKKPILKDGTGKQHKAYRKLLRAKQKQFMKNGIYDIPHRNSLINPYDYHDYIFLVYSDKSWVDLEGNPWITPEDEAKARRK